VWVCVRGRFSFGCEIDACAGLFCGVGVGVGFYSRRSFRLVVAFFFRVLSWVSLWFVLVFNALFVGVVGETSTESLILAQDERWRRA
jgi:hypothetical protein